MVAMTRAARRAAARKGAATRRGLLNEKRAEPTHSVELPDDARTPEQEVAQALGFEVPSAEADWTRPSELEAPEARHGYTQRWIRIRIGAEDDPRNSMRKIREGWLPRRLDTVPEGFLPPTFSHSRLGDVIGVEDLILCEMPLKKARQRNAHYAERRRRMVEGIENDMRKVDQGGPRIDMRNKTQVTKRRLRIPEDPAE